MIEVTCGGLMMEVTCVERSIYDIIVKCALSISQIDFEMLSCRDLLRLHVINR